MRVGRPNAKPPISMTLNPLIWPTRAPSVAISATLSMIDLLRAVAQSRGAAYSRLERALDVGARDERRASPRARRNRPRSARRAVRRRTATACPNATASRAACSMTRATAARSSALQAFALRDRGRPGARTSPRSPGVRARSSSKSARTLKCSRELRDRARKAGNTAVGRRTARPSPSAEWDRVRARPCWSGR